MPQVVFYLALDFESSNRVEIRDSVRTMIMTEAKLEASAILSIRLAPGSIQVTVELASDADVEAFNAAVVSAASTGGLHVNGNPILQQNPGAGADTSDGTTEDGSTGGGSAGGSASVGAAVGAVLALVALVVAGAVFTLRGKRRQRPTTSSPSLGEAERGATPPIMARSISSSAAMPRHVKEIIYEEAGLQTAHPSPPAPRHLYLPNPTSTNADTLSVSHDYEEMPSREEHTHLNVMYDGERRAALHNNVADNAVATEQAEPRPYLQPSVPKATPYSRPEEAVPGAPIYAEIDTLELGEELPVYRSADDVARDPQLVYAACGDGAVAYRAAADAEGDYRLATARPRVTPYATEEIPAMLEPVVSAHETYALACDVYSDGDVSDDECAH